MPVVTPTRLPGSVSAPATPTDVNPATPWGVAADAGVAVAQGSQNAAVATAGFFGRLGKRIGSSF
jgi:hypothetical protein